MISAASLATLVPARFIAKPTSALFNAGASLVPSPVTATTLPYSYNPTTMAYLSSGRDRAITSKFPIILLKTSLFLTVSILTSSSDLFYFFASFALTGQLH